MLTGIINKIIPFSAVDGFGNRTVIFFQGCNFNCLYCHNPETITTCSHCGDCAATCPTQALRYDSKNKKIHRNSEICTDCDKCLTTCTLNSSPKVKEMTVEQIMSQINKLKLFISGVTISGGECTVQHEFLFELLVALKQLNINVLLDTNGHIESNILEILIPYFDKIMLDIKSFDNEEHIKLTGVSNKTILNNFDYLAKLNKIQEIRTVIVPEILNNQRNVSEISKLIYSINSEIYYKLIRFQPQSYRAKSLKTHIPTQFEMLDLQKIASINGCKNVVIV